MLGAARHASYMRHAPCLGAAGAVSLRARAVSSFRTGWSGGRMHGGEAVVYRRERSGREGHRRQSRTGRDAEGRRGGGGLACACRARRPCPHRVTPAGRPGRQARPAGPAPEPRPQPALDTSAGDSAEGARASALHGRWHRRLPTRLAYSSLSLSSSSPLPLGERHLARSREYVCRSGERQAAQWRRVFAVWRVWVTRIWLDSS